MTYVRIPTALMEREPEDPGPGQHLWSFVVAFRMSDEVARQLAHEQSPEGVLLDHENILMSPGPGCFKCEEPFNKRLYFRKCTGTMEVQQ